MRRVPATSIALAAFYVAGPVVMALELLKPLWSIPLALLSIGWLASLGADAFRHKSTERRPFPYKASTSLVASVATLIACAAWVAFSGIGHFAICRWDYIKHIFVFSELMGQALPIHLETGEGDFILHYNVAYYITPVRLFGLVEELFRDVSLDWVLVVTYALALFTALKVLAAGHGVPAPALVVILALAGGLDIAGMAVFSVALYTPELHGGVFPDNMEWWGVTYAPQAPTAHLYWAPQHFFAALIGVALLDSFLGDRRRPLVALSNAAIVVVASSLWSAYVAVGLASLALVRVLIIDRAPWQKGLLVPGHPLLTGRALVPAGFAAALLAFSVLFHFAAVPLSPPKLLLSEVSLGDWLLTFLLNHAPFLVVLFILLMIPTDDVGKDGRGRLIRTVAGCIAAGAALLLFVHGRYNDWGMRATLPLWIALAVATSEVLFLPLPRILRMTLVITLVLAGASSVAVIGQSVTTGGYCPPYGSVSLEDLGPIAPQYRGRSDSFLYRYLVRDD